MTLEEKLKEVSGRMFPDFYRDGKVYCKKCGQLIKQVTPMSHYVEIAIACTDGSNHITHCCTDCARALSKQDLDDFLLIDGIQMITEAVSQKQELSEGFMRLMLARTAAGE